MNVDELVLPLTAHRGSRGWPARAAMLGAAVATVTAQVPASAQSNPFGGLIDQVRNRLGVNAPQGRAGGNGGQTSNVAAGIGALLGVGACRAATQDDRNARTTRPTRQPTGGLDLCLVAGVAAAAVTKALSTEIMKGVKENDREKILTGAAQAVDTGQPVLLALPDSKVQLAIKPTGRKVDRQSEVSFAVDNRLMDPAVPPLRIFGQPYVAVPPPAPAPAASGRRRRAPAGQPAPAVVPVYFSPDEGAQHPGSLAGNETVHVIGQVIGQPWMLVGRWVSSGQTSVPMAIGYVREAQLQPAAMAAVVPPANPRPAPTSLQVVTMTATLRCEESEFTKVDARQRETRDVSSVCDLPQGGKTMVA